MVNILHYDLISEFRRQFYKDLLTKEDIVGPQVKFDKLSYPNGNDDDAANFWGYVLEKGGVRYLLSAVDADHNEININTTLPLFVTKSFKVANKGNVYVFIEDYQTAKLSPRETMSFREMVDILSNLKHTNPDHQKLMWFMSLSQMTDRANFRICTPAGFGKDSTIDILGNLIGGAGTVENPTIAKLEFLTYYKLLAINEVVDVSPSDWRNIQQFLLAAGAHKPEVTKHSRATAGGVKEVLDISKFSMTLMYNDIDHYALNNKYFDDITKTAVKDRFPCFRLYGTLTEDFNEIKNVGVQQFVKENFTRYENLVRAYEYYSKHVLDSYSRFEITGLQTIFNKNHMPSRWKTNIGRLLKVIDCYCATQEEFNYWLNIINESIQDYFDMLDYPSLMDQSMKKSSDKEFKKLYEEIQTVEVFTKKKQIIKRYVSGKRNYTEQPDIWQKIL